MATGNMFAHRVEQGLGAIEIGETLGEVQRTGLRSELRHGGENGGADIRQLAGDHSVGPWR